MVCFRCDGKGEFKNEFGIMEKCESCQRKKITDLDEKVTDEGEDK